MVISDILPALRNVEYSQPKGPGKSMTKELMKIEIDKDLKEAFLACVSRAYHGNVEHGIIDLMRIYVERAMGTPGQKQIKEKVKEFVFEDDVATGLSPREIEKLILNKTEEDIESARLDK